MYSAFSIYATFLDFETSTFFKLGFRSVISIFRVFFSSGTIFSKSIVNNPSERFADLTITSSARLKVLLKERVAIP